MCLRPGCFAQHGCFGCACRGWATPWVHACIRAQAKEEEPETKKAKTSAGHGQTAAASSGAASGAAAGAGPGQMPGSSAGPAQPKGGFRCSELLVVTGGTDAASMSRMQEKKIPETWRVCCTQLYDKPEDMRLRGCTGESGSVQYGCVCHAAMEGILRSIAEILISRNVAASMHCKKLGLYCNHGKHRSVAVAELTCWALWVCGTDRVNLIHSGQVKKSMCQCDEYRRRGSCPEVLYRCGHGHNRKQEALELAELQEDDRIRARIMFLGQFVEAFKAQGVTLTPIKERVQDRSR